ncbi:MAG: hypothetical protein HND59_06335 [Pseudomonadota bacterium]|nr:MAG: hypothetical protein HND59_06335 [Pseudomonadota bacterium]
MQHAFRYFYNKFAGSVVLLQQHNKTGAPDQIFLMESANILKPHRLIRRGTVE